LSPGSATTIPPTATIVSVFIALRLLFEFVLLGGFDGGVYRIVYRWHGKVWDSG
jgi:hypothetical protein